MDFNDLPDNLFMQVFRRLLFREKCRIFEIAVSQTTSLQLDDLEFGNLPVTSLSKMFDLCRENLEEIWLPANFIETFAEFSFPRLVNIKLKLDDNHGIDWVEVILANNPAVKDLSLELSESHSGQFGSTGVTFANLTRLVVSPKDAAVIVDGNFLRLLTGRCPSLKELVLLKCQLHDETGNVFEDFFAHCPSLEEVNLGYAPGFNFFDMESFWRLNLLQKLVISYVSGYISQHGDDFLVKVANSFPRLQHLQVYGLKMTNRGVGVLALLENLAVVDACSRFTDDVESSLFHLAQNGKLKVARFNCWVSPSTFLTIVSNCPNLETLDLDGIWNIETPDAAAQLLTSLGRWNKKRNLRLSFHGQTEAQRDDLWLSSQVKSALKNLRDTVELNVEIDTLYAF